MEPDQQMDLNQFSSSVWVLKPKPSLRENQQDKKSK